VNHPDIQQADTSKDPRQHLQRSGLHRTKAFRCSSDGPGNRGYAAAQDEMTMARACEKKEKQSAMREKIDKRGTMIRKGEKNLTLILVYTML
jgi:hypothetical protein